MVIELVLDNFAAYVFGNYFIMGLAILGGLIYGAATLGIDRSSILIIIAPFVLVAGKVGFLPAGVSVLAFIGILLLWGIMFKLILGK